MHEEVVFSLKNHQGFVSGEELSRSLNISRAAIWKNIEELRKKGYHIEAVSHKGYRLLSVPDKILPWEIKHGLGTKVIGKKIICKQRVDSTMDEAFRIGFEGAQEGTVIFAESQTRGRGRMGRKWVSSEKGGIYFSLILRPSLSLQEAAKLTLLTAVSCCEAMREFCGLKAQIKWPNDLFVNGKKVAGILTELSAEVDRIKFVVIGIGINVNSSAKNLPPQATSLKTQTKKHLSRVDLIKRILRSIEHWYAIMQGNGFDPVFSRWRELSMTLGNRVLIRDMDQSVEGIALDISQDGGLLVRNDEGQIIKKMSGDVENILCRK